MSEAILAALPNPAQAALFLDFDGTLVDLAQTPDGITVPPGLPDLLVRLSTVTGGALALVSGRAVQAIEGFLPGFNGTIVGGHGAEVRRAGKLWRHPFAGSAALVQMTRAVQSLAQTHPGLLAEPKPTGVVLHFRRVPEMAQEMAERMQDIRAPHKGVDLHHAKMAIELRPDDIGKARAVADLLKKAPFAGRSAVFFGDDATDEPAMRLCVETGGTACKVGEGKSGAPLRATSPDIVRAALRRWAQGGTQNDRPDRHRPTDHDFEQDPDRG